MRALFSLVVLAMSACNSTKPSRLNNDESAVCVGELRSWLTAVENEGPQGIVAASRGLAMTLVNDSVEILPLHLAPVVIINEASVSYDGLLVGDPMNMMASPLEKWQLPELHRALMKEGQYLCAEGATAPQSIIVQADAQTPWRVLRDVTTTIEAAGIDKILFAVEKPSLIYAAGTSSFRSLVDELMEPGAKGFSPARFDSCKGVKEEVGAFITANQKDLHRFHGAIVDAVRGCGCRIDQDHLRAVLWWTSNRLAVKHRYQGALVVPIVDGLEPQRVELASETPWSQAYEALAGRRQATYLGLEHESDSEARIAREPGHRCNLYKLDVPRDMTPTVALHLLNSSHVE